ncbi:MAG: hypothetical protein JO210_09520, partial [Acidobacteriaceae bacterium]|nr:hypothetical protein [Acidobacteriaceae bacterium]
GVSDTFGAALWALDFMFILATAGAAGVNMETGLNQLGWISWYSPIEDDEHGSYYAAPEYYGILAFAQASQGQRLALNYDSGGLNLTAYAVASDAGRLCITIVNKDSSQDVDASVTCPHNFPRCSLIRLRGPSLESKQDVMLGGSKVDPSGNWRPSPLVSTHTKGGDWQLRVPAASAAILILET